MIRSRRPLTSRLAIGFTIAAGGFLRRVGAVPSWRQGQARGVGRGALAGVRSIAAAAMCLVASGGPGDAPLLFGVTLRVQPQHGEAATKKLLVGHN